MRSRTVCLSSSCKRFLHNKHVDVQCAYHCLCMCKRSACTLHMVWSTVSIHIHIQQTFLICWQNLFSAWIIKNFLKLWFLNMLIQLNCMASLLNCYFIQNCCNCFSLSIDSLTWDISLIEPIIRYRYVKCRDFIRMTK